ncbi:hypothetical protein PsorP6_013216 [Peronosclerospora sorghi]|uniref:Uncharacterized protein n=1 Tax=Peronosclerospora sorghi TaxID=230839 RepID=A0ACC0WGM6_9STRA|nr:hypothetical protein PsorP6_013216 [Peronosclerospora sorghi]
MSRSSFLEWSYPLTGEEATQLKSSTMKWSDEMSTSLYKSLSDSKGCVPTTYLTPSMLVHLLHHTGVTPSASKTLVQNCKLFRPSTRVIVTRLTSSQSKTYGRKDDVQTLSTLSPTMGLLATYVVVGISSMGIVARYKSRDSEEDENVRIFNLAKRAVVKDRRVFEIVGYPKEFKRMLEPDIEGSDMALRSTEGSFLVRGDKGRVKVHYHQNVKKRDDHDSDIVTFDELNVECEDGTHFSALASFLQNQEVVAHQQSESLWHKVFFPMTCGLLIGGLASFVAIRIVRNRPFYLHKVVLDHVNNHDLARQLMGHPITSDRSKFVGTLTRGDANYTIPCSGPKGNGMLTVKAFQQKSLGKTSSVKADGVLVAPGTSWAFSTLVLSVHRNETRKTKSAKILNLLTNPGVVLLELSQKP